MPRDPIVNFRAAPAVRQRLVRAATANGRTLSDELRIAVLAHLEKLEAGTSPSATRKEARRE